MSLTKTNFKKTTTFHLRPNDQIKLTELARRRQRTRSELVRLVVEKEIEQAEQSGELAEVNSDPQHS